MTITYKVCQKVYIIRKPASQHLSDHDNIYNGLQG